MKTLPSAQERERGNFSPRHREQKQQQQNLHFSAHRV
jgi:hypothetical protein